MCCDNKFSTDFQVMIKFGLIFCLGIGTVLCDGGGRHHRRGQSGRQGRTLANYGSSQSADSGYSSPNDGGIYSSGFITNDADFGNQYSAQNVQPSYGQQAQYGSSGGQAQYASGGGGGQAQYGGETDDNIAMLEKAVPGTPGEDYPIYAEVPETSFVCDGQVNGGYYGDPEAECQVFHICTQDGAGGLSKYSFLCPNGTIFNQEYFICDWWFNFDCSEAEGLYSLNDDIAAEREAATQALLEAASSGQATYVSGASNSYSSPASNGYGSPKTNSRPRPASNGGRKKNKKNGGGRRKNNNRGQRPANNGYSAPSSQSYGAPSSGYAAPTAQTASAGYGAPTSPAASSYGAPASNGYGSPASSSYSASDDYEDSLPNYGKK